MTKTVLSCKMAWWFPNLYIPFVKLQIRLGMQPNWDQLDRMAERAFKVEVA